MSGTGSQTVGYGEGHGDCGRPDPAGRRRAQTRTASCAPAREVYAELGPDAPVDMIARPRSSGGKNALPEISEQGPTLVRAALEQSIAENLTPAIAGGPGQRRPTAGDRGADRSGDPRSAFVSTTS